MLHDMLCPVFCMKVFLLLCRWPEALAIADDHMANYPPPGLSQPNLDTHHLAEKVAMLVKSNVRYAQQVHVTLQFSCDGCIGQWHV